MKRFEDFNWEFDEEEFNDELTNNEFVKFLKDNGAYDKFIDILNGYDDYKMGHRDWNTISSLCDDSPPDSYIDESFYWEHTPDGYDYWNILDKKWKKMVK